jgi:glycosyltransferase involved in cell wall biosynthesis
MTTTADVPLRPLRVLLLARYGMIGASSRVRHYAYLNELAARGITVECDYLIDDDSIARFYAGQWRRWDRIALAYARRLGRLWQLERYDLVWIEKEALPGLPWALERQFYGRVATLVDLDDLWIARFEPDRRAPEGGAESSPLAAPLSREAMKFRELLRAATGVTAANVHLAAKIAALCGRQPQVFENSIDVAGYQRAATARGAAPQGPPLSPPLPRIGWIGTPFTANAYLPAVTPLLNRLTAEGLAVTRLIGAGDAVPDLVAERVPWSLDQEMADVASLDIGIMPLGGRAFDAGKSGWKLVQCMAAGMPVVASRIGFNADLVDEGVSGFLVDDLVAFEQRLRQLSLDPELRKDMGRAAQLAIAQRFEQRYRASILADLMQNIRNLPATI